MSYCNLCGKKAHHGYLNFFVQILITGGFGFIGGRLTEHLLKAGHNVIVGSRKLSRPSLSYRSTEVRKMNWNDKDALAKSCKGIDIIIHAAGVNAQECELNPKNALEFNGEVTLRFLNAAIQTGVKRFIYLSSAHVYSSPLEGLINEETIPTNSHPYATSSLAGDLAVKNANQLGKIQGIVLRISNSFGAPISKEVNCWMLLINDLCKQAVMTNEMVLKSNGFVRRDFISLTQVCKIIEFIAVDYNDLRNYSIYNVGSGKSQTVFSMAKLIQDRCHEVLGFKPNLTSLVSDSSINLKNSRLTYSNDRLLGLGIKINKNQKIYEIDELLSFCQSNFTLKKG